MNSTPAVAISRWRWLMLVAIVGAIGAPSVLAEPPLPNPPPTEKAVEEPVTSRTVGLEGIEYQLVYERGALELRSWQAGKQDDSRPDVVDLEPFGPGRVRSIVLAQWFRYSLCAVLELEAEGVYHYHYCVFPERSKADRTRNRQHDLGGQGA